MREQSSYEVLSSKNVNKFVENKNGFKFLPWSDAVASLSESYPTATWSHREWDNMPYLQTEAGCFVEVSVTIPNKTVVDIKGNKDGPIIIEEAITRTQLHPVLDYRNKSIKNPDVFDINTSIARAFVKCVALHGLGLYIYRGEDLPQSEVEALTDMRMELKKLLIDNNKYDPSFDSVLLSLNHEKLQEKISEYRD